MLHNIMVNMDGFTLVGLAHLTLLQWGDIRVIDRCMWSRRESQKRIARVTIYYKQAESFTNSMNIIFYFHSELKIYS